ncbi:MULTISPECIES: DUF4468 domain-containing protein [unclassified Psychrobacter]|uniref:DUF4468 domain-containing protein n=1 Tax=unclassified Psychrobacter TaxID=196806 RepID=UPI0025D09E40|nr:MULTISPECIES: DUF4468 domain-containing protein [unclassified Psychrobacter]
MRNTFLAVTAASFLAVTGCATMEQVKQPPMTQYQKVIDIPNTSKDEVYEGARQWFAKSFRDSNSVLRYQDKESGSIIGKGNAKMSCSGMACIGTPRNLQFTVKVDAKDNRARITFDDLMIHTPYNYNSGIPIPESTSKLLLDEEKENAKKLLDSTVDRFSNDIKVTSNGNDNW